LLEKKNQFFKEKENKEPNLKVNEFDQDLRTQYKEVLFMDLIKKKSRVRC
jgi:hypothetical protein